MKQIAHFSTQIKMQVACKVLVWAQNSALYIDPFSSFLPIRKLENFDGYIMNRMGRFDKFRLGDFCYLILTGSLNNGPFHLLTTNRG